MHQVIAVQPYYKVERAVNRFSQNTHVHQREIILYATRIVSTYREFPIREVYDMSFKSMGEDQGILYLHTKQGVYPYSVEGDPADFIEAFKGVIQNM